MFRTHVEAVEFGKKYANKRDYHTIDIFQSKSLTEQEGRPRFEVAFFDISEPSTYANYNDHIEKGDRHCSHFEKQGGSHWHNIPIERDVITQVDESEPENTKQFKVASISDNTNSFGLYGVILIAQDGEAWKIGSNPLYLPHMDDVIVIEKRGRSLDFTKKGWEIPERLLPDCPKEAVREVWSSTESIVG